MLSLLRHACSGEEGRRARRASVPVDLERGFVGLLGCAWVMGSAVEIRKEEEREEAFIRQLKQLI
jgi:hypothetical protein